ncbi:hypothetical protein [Alkalihalobacillus sp. CinArs1]|uniref:hypothetical protein n=1 Tax=Alkalihalobacillus sp. CinArs1 TaxID=2995314 RepID=UPI0022DD7898|nr:hypothetical protein [Alkalihalobacillus sp. CinArs1]
MNLNETWNSFLDLLSNEESITYVYKATITGIPFLYITTNHSVSKGTIEESIKLLAAKVMRGKRLQMEYSFVRSDDTLLVYRVRFLVPQEKMFCCGNLCPDCIRFRN